MKRHLRASQIGFWNVYAFLMANDGKCFNGDAHTAVTLLLVDVYEFSIIQ